MIKRKDFMLGALAGLIVTSAATAGGVIDWPTARAEPIAGASGRLDTGAGRGLAFAPPQGAPLSFADIFQKVAPAVVQINVTQRAQRPVTLRIPGLPFVIPNPDQGQGQEDGDDGPTERGAGSGFFISEDGYIVTNNHVVADAIEIKVVLADERELTARLIGRDEATDLAVIKVDGDAFPFVAFEEGAQPRVGDWVIAVGNPFGLGGTATAGIVSAQARQNVGGRSGAFVDFLQIDAAINTGNSGGPTFDIYGRVIGVNSAIISPTGGSVGIGFAVPASVAKPITDQLIRSGSVARGYVGLTLQSFSPDEWEAFGQSRDFKGAYIAQVTPDAPAARAGTQVGDVLVAVNGDPVTDSTDATRKVGAAKPGDSIRMEVLRNGRRVTLNVRAGTRPSETDLLASTQGESGSATPGETPTPQGLVVEGLSLGGITPARRAQYDLPETVKGVIITNVARGSEAAKLGLRAGLVITQAGTRPLAFAEDFQAVVAAAKAAGRSSVLLFVRPPQGGASRTVVLKLAAE